MSIRSALLAASALGVMLPFTAASAQSSAPASANVDDSEIIVTARKRQESILKVPVTTTVLSSAVIERANITGLFDVSKKTVGLNLGVASVESGALVAIRGFGNTAIDPGVDQSVSLNLDGLQLTQGMSYSVGTFDMQQIEVLKGPQALFFGKASPAGVISIRTNDPSERFELIGRAAYEAEAREIRNELIVSGPITDTLGVRVAALYDHFGGFFKNKATPNLATGALPLSKRLGKSDSFAIRGTLLYKPDSNFSARLKLTYTKDKQRDATVQQYVACPEGTTNLVAFAGSAFAAGENCKADRNGALVGMNPTAFPGMNTNNQGIAPLKNGKPASEISQKIGSLELSYTPTDAIDLTSVTGYYRLDTDVDYNCYASGSGAPACMTQKRLERTDFTQELRGSSDFGGPFNFTLGAFYQDGKTFDAQTLPGNVNYFLPPLVFEGNMTIRIKAYSGFGQARYKITPELELAGGARYTKEKRSLQSVTYSLPFTPFAPGVVPFNSPIDLSNPRLNSGNWAPEATVTWTPTNDFTLFGAYKMAYKSGSYNIVTPTNPAGPVSFANGRGSGVGVDRSYRDEKIEGFEIGIKTRLLDRQLSFNMTAYHYKASNLQVGAILPAAGGLPVLTTLNAASAKIKGIEADFNYRPDAVEGLEIFGAINYNRSRFSSFPNAPCLGGDTFADGCNQLPGPVADAALNGAFRTGDDPTTPEVEVAHLPPGVTAASLPANLQNGTPFRYSATSLAGYPLARAPDWSVTAGFSYQLPIGNDTKLRFGSDVQYSSKYLTILGLAKLRPYFYQKAYAKINANVSLASAEDRWELALIGNNLTNKTNINSSVGSAVQGNLFFVGGITGGPGRGVAGLDEQIASLDRGRELWVRLTVKFGS